MPAKRLSMRKIKEVLRLRARGCSDREVARSVNVARTTVRRIRRRAEEAGLSWPSSLGIDGPLPSEYLGLFARNTQYTFGSAGATPRRPRTTACFLDFPMKDSRSDPPSSSWGE